jgi:glycosyltransferase involved in cell wall biosynthesis
MECGRITAFDSFDGTKEDRASLMKVLMYGWEYPPHISGGLGIACYGIVQGLLANAVEVTLVLPQGVQHFSSANHDGSTLLAFSETINVQLTNKRFTSIIKPYISAQAYLQAKKSLPDDSSESDEENLLTQWEFFFGGELVAEVMRYAMRVGQLAATEPHDVIHVHDWLTILAGVEAKRMSGKPLIFHVHSLEVDRSGEHLNQTIYEIERYGLAQADQIIAVSHYTKNIIVTRYGIAAEKITVVHNGVFPTEIKYKTEQTAPRIKTVLFLGRVTYQKGPYYFIEAANKVLQQRKDIQFVIAGEGDLWESAIEHVAALRLGQHVHFTGFLDRESVEKIYLLSSIYVMPSVSEPFGISCLEALSHQVPVIISKQSGVAEVLQHAITVDFWDVNELAAKIMALIDHPMLYKELLESSARELATLSWDKAAHNILAVYQMAESN